MRTHTAVTLGLAALLIACDDASRPVAPDGSSLLSARATAAAATASQIARLRRFVAPFHQVEAGWSAPVTPCLEAPGLGAMGFHYGNPAFVGDGGAVNLLEPELLL